MCEIERLERRGLFSVSTALLNSWFDAGQGEYAEVISGYNTAAGPSKTWPTNVPSGTTYSGGNSTPALGDITKISYSTNYVYVNSPDLASYVMGPWYLTASGQVFPNFPSNQNETIRLTLGSYPSTTHTNTGLGAVGIAVNGVSIFNNQDAFSYNHNSGGDYSTNGMGTKGDGIWNRDAEYGEKVTFDEGNGHQPGNGEYHYHVDPTALRSQLNDNIDYVGTTNYFPYDPMSYLNHGQGADGTYVEHSTNLHHSPIIGWSFDGHPIYGPYGYSDPTNPNSAIKRLSSSFQLRSITTRTTLPGWAAIATFGANVSPDGTYTLSASQYGPAVSTTYPLGRYGEDYAYVPGSGDLDQYNGRFTVTPEFPNGVYAYFTTINADASPAYPYLMGRQYYGTVNSGKVTTTTGDGAVTVVFDVSSNTAPVVAGPSSASVAHGAVLSLTGTNLITVTDVDAAATETLSLAVTGGTMSVSLASGGSITAGADNSSSMTLSGGVSQLNAALATLSFTAPSTGNSVTLTAQVNDGSALNNLSNTLTTTVTLTNVPLSLSGSSFYLKLDGDGQHLDVWTNTTGAGAVSQSVLLSLTSAITVTGTTGSDSLSVDFSAGDPLAASGLSFNGAAGTDALTIIGSDANNTIAINSGSVTIDGAMVAFSNTESLIVDPKAGSDSMSVNAGVVQIPAATGSGITARIFSNLAIAAGAALKVNSPDAQANRAVIIASTLSLDLAGLLDLGSNDMIIRNGGAATLADMFNRLQTGLNAGAGYWNAASGIISNAAASDSTYLHTLGVMLNSGAKSFDNQTSGENDVLVKYASYGDADLTGILDGADYQQIDLGFGMPLTGWSNGDFNYDGNVNGSDFALIDNAFNQQTAAMPAGLIAGSPVAMPLAILADAVPAAATNKSTQASGGAQTFSAWTLYIDSYDTNILDDPRHATIVAHFSKTPV